MAPGTSSGNAIPAAVAPPAVEPDLRKRTADLERRAKRDGASRAVPQTKGKPKKGNNECGIRNLNLIINAALEPKLNPGIQYCRLHTVRVGGGGGFLDMVLFDI
jgi:hypothetical protein